MDSMQRDQVTAVADALQQARHTVVLTGAGASTESGLPDWRGPAGLWRRLDPTRVASMTALYQHPVEFYAFYRERLSRLGGAQPNPTHRALARLEGAGLVHCLITQNVDGLHQLAGHREVVEVHGSLREAACARCGRKHPIALLDREVRTAADAPRCRCGGPVKPGVVLFEEVLPADAVARAFAEAGAADLFMVVGSSLEVGPVNMLPEVAISAGADLILVNLEPTQIDHQARWVVRIRSGEFLTAVAAELGLEH